MRAWLLAALAVLPAVAQDDPFAARLKAAIDHNLGRPYVWGSTGYKSFDCSGFVWRVHTESGVWVKRTTARKLWFSLDPPAKGKEREFGNLVFFDDLRHVGVVNDRDTFFHAAKTTGTARATLDPYWRKLYGGIRTGPGKSK